MSRNAKFNEQNINVYVRIRPDTKEEKQLKHGSIFEISAKQLVIRNVHGRKYNFDRVFHENTTQEEVYDRVVRPLISEVFAGYNCTVLAYGQTGSGKTHTLTGGTGELAGIIPRTLSHIFDHLETLNTESSIRVSYIQLYNEEVIDMLATKEVPIRIYEDRDHKGSVILQGVKEVSVGNKSEVYSILERGQEKRKTAPTLMNINSSRSHTVFTVVVHTRETTPGGEELVKTGKINLVDLAGAENILRSGSVDLQAREAGSINQSLLTLGRVIKVLTENSVHIPYRESKLTRILQDSLGGSTKTSIIATVSSSSANTEETLSTLDYASRAKTIKNRPVLNQKISRACLLQQYALEIERLEKDLRAAQTKSGFFMDEENYKILTEKTQKQQQDLNDKIDVIRQLRSEIEEKTETLRDMKESWTAAANNAERLRIEKSTYENHFHAYSETMHDKLENLYRTADNNRDSTAVFRESYNSLNVEVGHIIDGIMESIINCEIGPLLNHEKEKLGRKCSLLVQSLARINQLAAEVNLHEDNEFPNASQLNLASDFQSLKYDINDLISNSLPRIKSYIELIEECSRKEIRNVFSMLKTIKTRSLVALGFVSDRLDDLHRFHIKHNEFIIRKLQQQNDNIKALGEIYNCIVSDQDVITTSIAEAHRRTNDTLTHLTRYGTAETAGVEDIRVNEDAMLETLATNHRETVTNLVECNEQLFEGVTCRLRDGVEEISEKCGRPLREVASEARHAETLVCELRAEGNEGNERLVGETAAITDSVVMSLMSLREQCDRETEVVEEFCVGKLRHPTPAGDTPQRGRLPYNGGVGASTSNGSPQRQRHPSAILQRQIFNKNFERR